MFAISRGRRPLESQNNWISPTLSISLNILRGSSRVGCKWVVICFNPRASLIIEYFGLQTNHFGRIIGPPSDKWRIFVIANRIFMVSKLWCGFSSCAGPIKTRIRFSVKNSIGWKLTKSILYREWTNLIRDDYCNMWNKAKFQMRMYYIHPNDSRNQVLQRFPMHNWWPFVSEIW